MIACMVLKVLRPDEQVGHAASGRSGPIRILEMG